jgi:phage terminase small subunit
MSKKRPKSRRELFTSAYLRTLNASEAAREAGYSEEHAAAIGSRLLRKQSIKVNIDAELDAVIGADRAALKKRILDELEQEAFGPGKFEDVGPKGGTVAKANPNKMRALEILAKYMGMLVEKHEHTGKDGGDIVIKFPDGPNATT